MVNPIINGGLMGSSGIQPSTIVMFGNDQEW